MTDERLDHPFDEVAADANRKIMEGHVIFQKFTCAGCRSRQTMPEPNKFWELGTCQECGHTTNIRERGCGILTMTGVPLRQVQEWMHELYPGDVPPPTTKREN